MSETFADHLIEEMENFGQWSSGQNQVCLLIEFDNKYLDIADHLGREIENFGQ